MTGVNTHDIPLSGPWDHVDIAANGARFHLARGRSFTENQRLIVLLHGFAEFWWAWRHQIPVLDAAGYAVAALDLRGYGASDKTPRGYDPRTSAADIAGVIRSLGHRQAVLVGHDWGGMAAWATAAFAPEQVTALAMIGAPHPLAFPWRQSWPQLGFFQLPIVPERRIMADDGAYVEEFLRARAAPDREWLSADDARRYREALRLWPSPHCALEYQRMFVRDQLRGAGRAYRRALRRRVRVSLLSIHGQQDPVLPAEKMTAAERFITGRHVLVSLPDVGHFPHEEDPVACNTALLRWLNAL